MRYSTSIAAALFAASAYAQIDTVTGVLDDVQSGIESLDTAVQGFSGDSGPLVEASQALVGTLTDGQATVEGSEDLDLADALQLQGPVEELTTVAQGLVDNLKAQKSAIAEGGFCDETRTQITDINSASNALIDAVVSKVPVEAQPIAEDLSSGLRTVLQEAQDEFSEENCQNTGGDGDDGGSSSEEPTQEPTDAPEPTETPGPTDEPTDAPEPTDMPTPTDGGGGDGSSEPTDGPTDTGAPPPGQTSAPPPTNGTSTDGVPPPVVTAGAAGLIPAGALAFGFAALLM